MKFINFCFLVFLLNSLNSFATKYIAATCPGPLTWSGFGATTPFFSSPGGTRLNTQPAAGDVLEIPAGCTVSVSGVVSITNSITIEVYGQLRFPTSGDKIQAPNGTVVNVYSGGSIYGTSNSNQITIGSGGPDFVASGGTYNGPFQVNQSGNNLPIELLSFSGICAVNGVQLNWSTATEKDNQYFTIEKSTNGIDWTFVSKVYGNGTSYITNRYSFVDNTNTNELLYYKLNQFDKNGSSTAFSPIDISCKDNEKNQMILYPNPSSTELNILLSVNTASPNSILKVLNNIGQVVIETKIDLVKGLNNFVLPIEINSGSYSIFLSSENISLPSQKLIILK